MANTKLLEQKRLELEQELAQWAKQTRALEPAEQLKVTVAFEILKNDQVKIKMRVRKAPKRRAKLLDKPFGTVDWKQLSKITTWNDDHRTVLELIRQKRNQPVPIGELIGKLRNYQDAFSIRDHLIESINQRLRTNGLPYLLAPTQRYEGRYTYSERDEELQIKMWHVKHRLPASG